MAGGYCTDSAYLRFIELDHAEAVGIDRAYPPYQREYLALNDNAVDQLYFSCLASIGSDSRNRQDQD